MYSGKFLYAQIVSHFNFRMHTLAFVTPPDHLLRSVAQQFTGTFSEEASRDRLVYGLFLWMHEDGNGVIPLVVAVITLVMPHQAMFQKFYSHYKHPGS